MNVKEICIHGTLEWKDGNSNRVSNEYFEGAYRRTYCNLKGTDCSFSDYHDCALWEKKDKE